VIVAVHLNVNDTVAVIRPGGDHDHGVVPVHVHGHGHGVDHVDAHDHAGVITRLRAALLAVRLYSRCRATITAHGA
jgi:hypothetical protein